MRDTPGARIRALRNRLGWTQEGLGRRAGFPPERLTVYVSQFETGKNGATSWEARVQLARGFDVPVESMAAYLDGEIGLAGILALRGRRAEAEWWRAVAEEADREGHQ